MSTYDVYSEFDLEKHKATFINYLEVIIDKEGKVHYAVPSHQQFLMKLACKQMHVNEKKLETMIPFEYYGNFMVWLCGMTNCVAVWTNGIIGKPNLKQKEVILKFIEEGLIHNENDHKESMDW